MSMDAHDSNVMDGAAEDTLVYCHRCDGDGVIDFGVPKRIPGGHGTISTLSSCRICDGRGWVYKWQYEGQFPATRWP